MADFVCGPTTPSEVRPFVVWKVLIARFVCGPNSPSKDPGLNPLQFKYLWISNVEDKGAVALLGHSLA